ncbi:MAG: endonuclease III [Candidatus Ryanbacteria bacterium RIFCSPHIGHO2_02_FULL_45_43]|uniref:Endonuclease III n=1 Tax=Candidatus Ryanbacteria bacterium RIFCSPHIGHO2_01_45_13 TaxID=1802112 RepID=A0A1G2FZC3_9BACT|nr:MAG: endonuclease III [Candidatus Ryanbacteria bacterium RIFCSPHIGHO2_01_FULL_44_130]OGZ43419.1 MAG: endonuclease III [Candidatus Ryanbacteria bacterium RIFCSPHIGHO2_01_45_13]OGZ48989.1 MAG: endonuclease III [Candidatus Ryanbacteria bacterium RIFCSPHIGHO2_02_FULL_45_43]OGZ50989.1 MAG: endonuclease III [Candidatus Ryanbacteria bacterium RIFCSPHIGHO2_12_FULL_44_20]OGZ51587.1 MAG: endonuclease III [Candidatus Ryanbacteria bacterium RIFCSPLOWO2_01_FULL_44_230]OGZ53542.1 MAG: endonuclease III [C
MNTESEQNKKKRAGTAHSILKKYYPTSKITLRYATPVQLLVSVMLSAQCTDKKVNEVTAAFFNKYKTAKDYARIKMKTLEGFIRPTGFYHSKAKNIVRTTRILEKRFGGKLPKTMEEMLKLPGVARKTANVVLINAYGIVEGIPVDTHVGRIAQRLGFSNTDNPKKIEHDLMKLFPKKEWGMLSYRLIDHGRNVCTAKNRKCVKCPLKKLCPSSLM